MLETEQRAVKVDISNVDQINDYMEAGWEIMHIVPLQLTSKNANHLLILQRGLEEVYGREEYEEEEEDY